MARVVRDFADLALADLALEDVMRVEVAGQRAPVSPIPRVFDCGRAFPITDPAGSGQGEDFAVVGLARKSLV